MSDTDDADMADGNQTREREPGFGEEESGGQWIAAKKWAASELKELTQLWQVESASAKRPTLPASTGGTIRRLHRQPWG